MNVDLLATRTVNGNLIGAPILLYSGQLNYHVKETILNPPFQPDVWCLDCIPGNYCNTTANIGAQQACSPGGTFYPWPCSATPTSGSDYYRVDLKINNSSSNPSYAISSGTLQNATGTTIGVFPISGPVTLEDVMRITYSVPSLPTLSAVVTHNTDCASPNGAIDLTVSGGTSPFSYQWTGPNGSAGATQDLSSLEAGTYYVTVTSSGNCETTGSWTVNGTNTTTIIIHDPVNVCLGDCRRISLSNPNPNCTYTWYDFASGLSPIGTGNNVCYTPTTSGVHTVQVFANCGGSCSGSDQTSLIVEYGTRNCENLPHDACCSGGGDDDEKIHINPNPAHEKLEVASLTGKTMKIIQVVSLESGAIHAELNAGETTKMTIPVNSLGAGKYVVRVEYTDGTFTSALFIKE